MNRALCPDRTLLQKGPITLTEHRLPMPRCATGDFAGEKDLEKPVSGGFQRAPSWVKRGSDDDQLNIARRPGFIWAGTLQPRCPDSAVRSVGDVSLGERRKPPIDTMTVADRARKRSQSGLDDGRKTQDGKLGNQDDGGKRSRPRIVPAAHHPILPPPHSAPSRGQST